MEEKDLERFLSQIDSRYRAVIMAAKRAKQLQRGLRPLFEGKSSKVTTMALEELISGKVEYFEAEPAAEEVENAEETVAESTETKKVDSSDDVPSIEDVFPENTSISETNTSSEPVQETETGEGNDTDTSEQMS